MKESNTNKEIGVNQEKIFTPKNDILFKLLFGSKR